MSNMRYDFLKLCSGAVALSDYYLKMSFRPSEARGEMKSPNAIAIRFLSWGFLDSARNDMVIFGLMRQPHIT